MTTDRLDVLERRCRILAGCVVASLALGAAAVLRARSGQGALDFVEARSFVVVDREGRKRAVLEAREDGWVGLKLFRPDSTDESVNLAMGAGGVGLQLFDQHGVPRVEAMNRLDAGPSLALRDDQGKPRALLSLTPKGDGGLVLADQGGKARGHMTLVQGSGASLQLGDRQGGDAVVLRATDDDDDPEGSASVSVGRKSYIDLSVSRSGGHVFPTLIFHTSPVVAARKAQVTLGVDPETDKPYLGLRDASDGAVLFSKP